MTKKFLVTAGISGFIAVLMSALGSHFLLGKLTPQHEAAFYTAIQMQMYHTLAILAITFFNRYVSRSVVKLVYYLFLLGILFFSFPIYVNATTEVTGLSMGPFSLLTPVGGFLFMAGWLVILWSGLTYVHNKRRPKEE